MIYKNSDRTSQKTHFVSATKTSKFRERIAVYCENHTKHTNTLWAEFYSVKAHSTYSDHWTLNSGVLIRQRTIPTERPPLVGEVNANFSG
jgi:hypothetical protein